MKPARIAVICIAAVAAIGLAIVVRTLGSSDGGATTTAAAAVVPERPMAKVLVAARDLQPGQRLANGDLAWKDWAVDEVNPAFITDGSVALPGDEDDKDARAEDKDAAEPATPAGAVATVARQATVAATGGSETDYYGSVVREPILAGEPIVSRKIVRAGDSGYMAAYLEPGYRAMAIRVTVETAAGGFILPGDRVDVLLTRETKLENMTNAEGSKFASSTVMQNVKVLAIDQSTRAGEDEQAVVGATATLEVRPGDAEALALAKSEGELSLVLRSYADTAGPSGRVAPKATQESRTVRVFRGNEPQTVVVQ
ncbi:Flp pilus assembly protein CpaB [Brevundimonas variabilis]|uniref:Pilus assembly protein CpaB n=1 Tax=Brevundimonas variabilis TaxID=74312 RepID=A0A7W9CKE5_9CAUL|nr:Flp pilus assembly protein CpaB [Brevundimonas variabilis]MBB5747247.1 pilus assembly protein CpaB [Brevundimonas variabilis]